MFAPAMAPINDPRIPTEDSAYALQCPHGVKFMMTIATIEYKPRVI